MEKPIHADPNTIIKITEKTRKKPEIPFLIMMSVGVHNQSVTPFAGEEVTWPIIIGIASELL